MITKIIKWTTFGLCVYKLFPNFNGGVFLFVLKFMFYVFLLYICQALINESINYIKKNWMRIYLKWVDEREHIKTNSFETIKTVGFIRAAFRLFNYLVYNKRKLFYEFLFLIKNNLAMTITILISFLLLILIIIMIITG